MVYDLEVPTTKIPLNIINSFIGHSTSDFWMSMAVKGTEKKNHLLFGVIVWG